MEADWAGSWTALNGFLIFFLPIAISAGKYFLPSLDGPPAYWLGLGVQFAVGLLYEGAKRTGLAKGSRERGVR